MTGYADPDVVAHMAMTLDKSKLQLLVVLVILGLWAVGVLVAVWDGTVMLKATTPLMTMALGWLFTQKVTEG